MSEAKRQSPAAAPGSTLPGMLKAGASTYAGRPWMRKKQSGLWREYSWREGLDTVRRFSLGLSRLGFQPGEMLGIVGESDPQWFWAEIAAQAAGGSALGLSAGWSGPEIAAAVRRFGVRFVAAADRQQVDKLLRSRDEVPSLLRVIYWNGRGIEADQEPWLASFDQVAETGRDPDASQAGALDERMARIKASDTALTHCVSADGSALDSSALTHEALLGAIEGLRPADTFHGADRWFSASPPEGMVEQAMALTGSLTSGMSIDFAENQNTAQQDLREVASTLVCYPSLVWEGLAAAVRGRIEKTTLVKRALASAAGRAGSRRAAQALDGRRPGMLWKLQGGLAEIGYYRPLKARIGLANTRCVYSFGAKLTPETLRWLLGLGLNVRQLDVTGETIRVRQPDSPGSPELR